MRLGDACLFGLDWGSSSDLYRQALMETADDAVRARCQVGLAVASRALREASLRDRCRTHEPPSSWQSACDRSPSPMLSPRWHCAISSSHEGFHGP